MAGVRGRGEWGNSGALICHKRVTEKGGRLTFSSALRTFPCLHARFSLFFPLYKEIFCMFRNIHYIYPDKFFLWMDFRYSSVKADFHSTSFWLVVWRVDYNKLTTRVLPCKSNQRPTCDCCKSDLRATVQKGGKFTVSTLHARKLCGVNRP